MMDFRFPFFAAIGDRLGLLPRRIRQIFLNPLAVALLTRRPKSSLRPGVPALPVLTDLADVAWSFDPNPLSLFPLWQAGPALPVPAQVTPPPVPGSDLSLLSPTSSSDVSPRYRADNHSACP